jgi:hypothetical protein
MCSMWVLLTGGNSCVEEVQLVMHVCVCMCIYDIRKLVRQKTYGISRRPLSSES